MRKAVLIMLAGLVAGALPIGGLMAGAADGDVIKEGSCSAGSTWKIKNSPEDGAIEIEWEVDQNVNGDVWSYRIRYNGVTVKSGQATTVAPSGSFEVQAVVANNAGTDRSVATATNLRTGETCRGVVSSNF